MFCPGCGSNNSIEQKFCRACGINLERSAAALAEQFPDGALAQIERRERLLERYGSIVFTGFGTAFLLGMCLMLYVILDRFIFSGSQPLVGILLAGILVFSVLSLGYVVMREALKDQRAKLTPSVRERPEIAASVTAPLLDPAAPEPIGSVVENTTQLLERLPK